MATVYKNAQVQGTASTGTYATMYTTTSASSTTSAVISSIVVTNTASTAALYRVGIMMTAGTPAAANWVVYDATVQGNDTVCLTLGITLPAGASCTANNFIRVSSSANTVTFSAYVSEIS